MKSFFSSPPMFSPQLLDSPMPVMGPVSASAKTASPHLACGNSSLAVRDNEKPQMRVNDTPLTPKKTFRAMPHQEEKLPLWVRNRKLLTKIFIIWVALVIFMLLNVFDVINLI